MKPMTFDRCCAQGDAMFIRIGAIPMGATPNPVEPLVKVAHSETGHHHAFCHGGVMTFECEVPNPLICYLRVEQPSVLEHLRSWDTHAPILFAPGDYEIRRQREWTPTGWKWKRVED